jgi:DNA-binding XRE family transcriptional regulator
LTACERRCRFPHVRKGTSTNLVRELRVRKLWTQKQLAKKARVSEWTVRMAELGQGAFNPITQEKIARALGVPRDVLFPSLAEVKAG